MHTFIRNYYDLSLYNIHSQEHRGKWSLKKREKRLSIMCSRFLTVIHRAAPPKSDVKSKTATGCMRVYTTGTAKRKGCAWEYTYTHTNPYKHNNNAIVSSDVITIYI